MATPRHLLVDPENECDYHLVSRCVRRAFLCGDDGDRDYSHRRGWLVERMRQLAPCFAVDVYAYTVLDNHFHLVLRHDPLAGRGWSDEEVAWRWFEAFPPTEHGAVVQALKPERRELMLDDPDRVARARRALGSMSDFMKHLKQPIARRANMEDDCTGHFFEQRFYSGALLTEEALIAAMAYVDLNPLRAKLAKRIEKIRDTSICERLQVNSAEALADYLRPVLSGLGARAPVTDSSPGAVIPVELHVVDGKTLTFDLDGDESCSPPEGDLSGHPRHPQHREEDTTEHPCHVQAEAESAAASPEPEPRSEAAPERPRRRPPSHLTLAEYIDLVRGMADAETGGTAARPDGVGRWLARTMALRKRQRAFGTEPVLRQWLADRSMQFRETPLPA